MARTALAVMPVVIPLPPPHPAAVRARIAAARKEAIQKRGNLVDKTLATDLLADLVALALRFGASGTLLLAKRPCSKQALDLLGDLHPAGSLRPRTRSDLRGSVASLDASLGA